MKEIPIEVIETTLHYLDGYALGNLLQTNRSMHDMIHASDVWKSQIYFRFGVDITLYPPQNAMTWRSIFKNLICDINQIKQSKTAQDIVVSMSEYKPIYPLTTCAQSIRYEIILMESLRLYPTNMILIQEYANFIRDHSYFKPI